MVRQADIREIAGYSPSLKGVQVEAKYLHQDIDSYSGNPFIEALPPIYEEDYVGSRIANYPSHNEEQRKLGKQTRLHLVQQISDYVEPLPIHLVLEQRISRLIRHGYKARNPFSAEFARQFHVGFKEIIHAGVDEQGYNLAGVRSTAAGFAMIGVSGQGKTTSIDSTLLLYPQVIKHVTYKGKPFIHQQLVWLKLNCPFDGSLKGLCINFLQAVDAHLGTRYFQKFVSKGVTVDILIPIMAQISSLHGLGLLVIDEIQNLSSLKSGGAEKMLNYFTQLINTIGVPVVTVGTYKALNTLSGSFSQARRGTGQGDLIMDRLVKGDEWDYFIERLWRYQWTKKHTPLSDALKKTMYDLSQGIIDIAVKLYMLAQWEAIGEEEKITSTLLKDVAKQHMQLVQPILKLLKSNEPGAQTKIDDLYPKWDVLDEYLQRASQNVHINGEIREHIIREEKVEKDQDILIELVKTAIDFGADAELAEKVANQIIQTSETDGNLVAMRTMVVKLLTKSDDEKTTNQEEKQSIPKTTRGRSRDKKEQYLDPDDLRNALRDSRNSDEIYQKLLNNESIASEAELIDLVV